MTTETMLFGHLMALAALGLLGSLAAWWTLRPITRQYRAPRRGDLATVAGYMLGVALLTYQEDLLLEDAALRVGIHAVLLCYGWWAFMSRVHTENAFLRLTGLLLVVPVVSGWASVGWLLNVDSLARVALTGVMLAGLVLPVGLASLFFRRWLLRGLDPTTDVRERSRGRMNGALRWSAMLLLAGGTLWTETRMVLMGDPFNERNLTRTWARELLSQDRIEEIRQWLNHYEQTVGESSVATVDAEDWPQAIRGIRPNSVEVHARAVRMEWAREGREPERGILIQGAAGGDWGPPEGGAAVRVRERVLAWRMETTE